MKIALVIEKEDESYLPYIKPLLVGHSVQIATRCPETCAQLYTSYDAVITTRNDYLRIITQSDKHQSIHNYSGSLFYKGGKPFLILDPLRDLVVSNTGIFIAKRYIKKITHPNDWFKQSKFTWELADEINVNDLYFKYADSTLIGIDIETTYGAPWVIKCVAYCFTKFINNTFVTHTVVLPYTTLFWVEWVRKFNLLPGIKVFQNGIFDNLYFIRFGSPVRRWLLDTLELFHCYYSELPKSLDYIALFLLRDCWYWKDDAKTTDLMQYYEYNARDAWATVNSILALLSECPEYAFTNYKIKFPLVYPCLSSSFIGLKYDPKVIDLEDPESAYSKQEKIVEASLGSLRQKLRKPNFKPNSPKQVLSLIHLLGCKLFTNADAKVLDKVAKRHPLNRMLVDEIIKYREAKKAVSTYFGAELIGGRLLYTLRTSGTATGRLSSTQSLFSGLGAQIQNFPDYAKEAVIADEGFYLGEVDNEQSEARCMGYISGDENLITTVESGNDFHSVNIERFFGVAYDEVWDQVLGKTKNKELRDLSKRVNHGTAYVMGAFVLLETMGLENVVKAQQLLGLPINWKPEKVCQYLLDRYHIAYPKVSANYYEWVKAIVKLSHQLVSALGWTRHCFGNPSKSSKDFKALVAHVPQNLSVGIINRGFLRVFREIQLENWKDFRITAQIHDSILFQYRIGRIDLAFKARALSEETVKIIDVKNKERMMKIPVALKAEAARWSEIKKIAI